VKPDGYAELIGDFTGLLEAVLGKVSQHKVATGVGHDRATVRRWRNGAEPQSAADIGNLIRTALTHGIDVGPYQTWRPLLRLPRGTLSYDDVARDPAPNLESLTTVQKPPSAPRKVAGLVVDCPLGVASGPLVADASWTHLMLDLGYGLTTLKTRRSAPQSALRPPQILYAPPSISLDNYDSADPPEMTVSFNPPSDCRGIPNLVNSIGIPSDAPEEWQEVYRSIKRHPRGQMVGISVMGDGLDPESLVADFERVVRQALDVAPPFIELNLSCPNQGRPSLICEDRDTTEHIIAAANSARRGRDTRLFIKLPFLPKDILRELLKHVGPRVHGVVISNTLRVRPVMFERGRSEPAFPSPREVAGLSGPATFPLTRTVLKEVVALRKQEKFDFAVIGVGGITSVSEVIELLDMGVDAAQTCTAALFDPLLAWKVRFAIARNSPELRGKRRQELGFSDDVLQLPENPIEHASYRNAEAAVGELRRRKRVQVPHDVFVRVWNDWKFSRTDSAAGQARRSSARTVPEWIKIFEASTQ